MKHTYKSMLFAAMALAVGTAGYFGNNFRDGVLLDHFPAQQSPSAHQEQAAGLSASTIESIKSKIAEQEYHISYDEGTRKLQSPNRKQNLRAYYKPGEFIVQNRVDSAGHNFKLQFKNEGIFADGKKILAAQANAKPSNIENKLLIDHEGFTEEFINTEEGVRQNFIVKHAPDNTRNLQVKLSAKGLKARNGTENEIHFYREDAKGKPEDYVVYSDLHCWDADKRPLNATLAYVDNRVEINVDVEGAAYPVTIDPIIANGNPDNVNKKLESEQSYAWFGYSISSAGDVNKDGYSDIIVGAPKYDWNGEDAGAAFVFPGSVSGVLLTTQRLNRNQPFAQMGYSVSSAGDVNKDGYSDVIVGSPYWEDSPAQNNEGAAFLYFGGPIDPVTAPIGINAGNYVTFQSDQAESGFGISVAMAGDVNADGWSDFMIGAHMYDKDQTNEGVVFLYYGLSNGLGHDPSKTEILERTQADAMFGYAIAGAGDVNADGASDIIIGARLWDINQNKTNEGAAFVYKGSVNSTPVSAAQPQIIEMAQADSRFGHTVSTAGDVNGDGYADIAIGAYYFDGGLSDEGAVYIHHGGQNGINVAPDKVIEGNQQNAQFGWAVASAGDVNGDGYGDLVVGARYFDNNQVNEGAAFVYHGSNLGLNSTAASMIESNQGDAWLGSAVASAGDVNGDGYSDILIGSYAFDHGQTDEGQVFVYHGSADVIGTTAKTMTSGTASNAFTGASVSSAGDVNGDGLDDVIIGAPSYDVGQINGGAAFVSYGNTGAALTMSTLQINQDGAKFGCSVSKAGDVNGDGYDDVIVGAKEAKNGVNVGAAYVFHGGPQTINLNPSSTLQGGITNSFGTSVSDAGDINRDGYDDVIVGAPTFTKNNPSLPLCGAVYIYLGSVAGINPQITPTIVTSGVVGTQLGNSLDNAGDVNGDGYADIVAGASQSSLSKNKEGAAFIWHGSSSGIPTGTIYNGLLTVNQADARMGISVAGAGDVNGDGYSDIIAGADLFDNGQSDEGIARVYYGSSAGCASANMTTLEVNQSLSLFGQSVGSAGDVNGDGYADVIVGASYFDNGIANEGAAFVYYGSLAGISTSSSFTVEGEDDNAHLGEAVSSAGDLNGDGYSDILIGIPNFDQGASINLGVAKAYFGNNGFAGKNRRHNIRLYNTNLTDNLNIGQLDQTTAGVGLFGSSFLGRNNARMVWGVVQHGTSFPKVAGYPITNSTVATAGQNSSMTTTASGYEYKDQINKQQWPATRVRVRIKHELATALTGQVYGPWRYLREYLLYTFNPQNREMSPELVEENALRQKNEEYLETVSIYPNPVADRLFIQSTNMDQVTSLQLVSANGTMAFTSTKPQSEVDVKHLPAGTYVLVINRKDGSKTSHKVLIKK